MSLYELAASSIFSFIDSTGQLDTGSENFIRGFYITKTEIWLCDFNNCGQFCLETHLGIDALAGRDGSYSFYLGKHSWQRWISPYTTGDRRKIDVQEIPQRFDAGGQNMALVPLDRFADPLGRVHTVRDIVHQYSDVIWGPGSIVIELDAQTAATVHKMCYIDTLSDIVRSFDRYMGKKLRTSYRIFNGVALSSSNTSLVAAGEARKRKNPTEPPRPTRTDVPDKTIDDTIILELWLENTVPGEGRDSNLRCRQDAFPAFYTWATEKGFAPPEISTAFSLATARLLAKSMIPNLKKSHKKLDGRTTTSFAGRLLNPHHISKK